MTSIYPDDNTVYSFDPGKITGVAKGDTHGNLFDTIQYDEEQLWYYLESIRHADVFIIEEFRIRPDKAQSFIFSEMQTIQIIGALKYKAHELSAEVVMQSPTIKSIGYKWAGLEPPKTHALSHSTDAYAHLSYFWVKTLKLEPIVMQTLRRKNGEAKEK
jgi:hypothetical protein